MKTIILLFATLYCTTLTFAGVERITLYFDVQDSVVLTRQSKTNLESFLELRKKNRSIQVIEINSFCESINDHPTIQPAQRAEKYLAHVITLLDIETENLTLNNFGEQRVDLNFVPRNWDRTDIYYFIPELPFESTLKDQSGVTHIDTNEVVYEENKYSMPMVVASSNNFVEYPRKVTDFGNSINIHEKIVLLKIEFIGGTADIKPGYEDFLYSIYDTLARNPNMTAHIRGHVCCGNKVSLSRKRAKVVYKYLVHKGIAKTRLSFEGCGNQVPLAFPERNAHDRSRNRRVDIVFDEPD